MTVYRRFSTFFQDVIAQLEYSDSRPLRGPQELFLDPESAVTRLARRETLRLPRFLWTTPFDTARMVSDSAARRASAAALPSPDAIASSTVRQEDRMRERRALLTAVRRAITRVAFFADFVFAMGG